MTVTVDATKHDLVSRSFGRCCNTEGFFDTFYSILRSSHPDIPKMFAGTDFEKQNKLLRVSLELMLMYDHGNDAAKQILTQIRKTHGRERLDIRPELYDLWVESLMKACAKHDSEFSAELETAWRERLQKGIDYIRSGYEEGVGEAQCMEYLNWIDPNLETVAKAWRGLPDTVRADVVATVNATPQ